MSPQLNKQKAGPARTLKMHNLHKSLYRISMLIYTVISLSDNIIPSLDRGAFAQQLFLNYNVLQSPLYSHEPQACRLGEVGVLLQVPVRSDLIQEVQLE